MKKIKTINRFRPIALLLACFSLAACGELRLELGGEEEEEQKAGFDLFRECMEQLGGHKDLDAAIRASCLEKHHSFLSLEVWGSYYHLSSMPELTSDHDEGNYWHQNWVRNNRATDHVITGIEIELAMSDELEGDALKCEEEGVLCRYINGTTWLVPGAPRKLVKYRGDYDFQSRWDEHPEKNKRWTFHSIEYLDLTARPSIRTRKTERLFGYEAPRTPETMKILADELIRELDSKDSEANDAFDPDRIDDELKDDRNN